MFILKKGHQPGVYVPLGALFLVLYMSRLVRKPVFGSDTNRAVKLQKMARGLKFQI